jgi:hypothetical protein
LLRSSLNITSCLTSCVSCSLSLLAIEYDLASPFSLSLSCTLASLFGIATRPLDHPARTKPYSVEESDIEEVISWDGLLLLIDEDEDNDNEYSWSS